jgi:hypothetical protein
MHAYAYACVCMPQHSYATECVFIYINIYTHIHTHAHTYIPTYIHTHTQAKQLLDSANQTEDRRQATRLRALASLMLNASVDRLIDPNSVGEDFTEDLVNAVEMMFEGKGKNGSLQEKPEGEDSEEAMKVLMELVVSLVGGVSVCMYV